MTVGDASTASGTLNVDGAGSRMEVQHDFNIGERGGAALNVTNGANLISDSGATFADLTGSRAVATVDAGSLWSVGNDLSVGHQGIATLTVSAGSQVSAANVAIGETFGASGTVMVSGKSATSASVLQFADELRVGDGGNGELDVKAGGLLKPSGFGSGTVSVASQPNSIGRLNVDGLGSLLEGGSLNVGGTSNTSGGNGRVTLSNGGAAQVRNTVNTWDNGVISVSGGALTVGSGAIPAATGTLQINTGGTLEGSGQIIGNVINGGGNISPGHSPGTLHINGNYTQGNGGLLQIQIAGRTMPEFDHLNVTGHVTLDMGAKLELDFINGFAPKMGDKFDFLQSGDAVITDNFSEVVITGLAPGFQFVLAPDGIGSFGLVALNDGVPATVPEPGTYAMLFLGLIVLAARFRQRKLLTIF